MRNTVDILGVHIDKITMEEAMENVKAFLSGDRAHAIYTPNAEMIMEAQKDIDLRNILNESDMLIADGAGVILGSRILRRNLPEKVSGIDLTRKMFSYAADKDIKFFFFGGKPGIAEKAAENMKKEYMDLKVCGCQNGYFSNEEEESIIDRINTSGTDILLVALGAPRQEKLINKNRTKLKAKVCIGIGGSLDIFSGNIKPAPEFMRQNGLEWLYRLCKEPYRYKRMLKLPLFVFSVIFTRIKYVLGC